MTRVILVTNLLIVAILASGCATIVTGQYQNISVTSEPPGATVRIYNGMSITTPGSFKLVRNQRYTLVAEYPGAEPQQKKLKYGVQGWFWGNILLVSGAGCAVDLTSGSAYQLIPDKVHFDFTSTGIAAVSRKRSYLETYPNIIDQILLADLNELYVKGMKEDEFQTSLGPPLTKLLANRNMRN